MTHLSGECRPGLGSSSKATERIGAALVHHSSPHHVSARAAGRLPAPDRGVRRGPPVSKMVREGNVTSGQLNRAPGAQVRREIRMRS